MSGSKRRGPTSSYPRLRFDRNNNRLLRLLTNAAETPSGPASRGQPRAVSRRSNVISSLGNQHERQENVATAPQLAEPQITAPFLATGAPIFTPFQPPGPPVQGPWALTSFGTLDPAWSPITAQPVPTEEQWQHIDLSPYIQAGPRSIEFGPGPSAPPPEAGNTYGLANAHDFVSLNPQTTPPMQTPTTGNMLQQAVASPPVPQNIPFNVPTNTLYQMAMPCLISSGDVRRITIVHSRGTDHIMACFDFTKPEGFIDEGFVESCHLSRHPFPTDWRGRGNRGHGNRGWVNLVVTSIENVASLGRPQIRIPLNVRAGVSLSGPTVTFGVRATQELGFSWVPTAPAG